MYLLKRKTLHTQSWNKIIPRGKMPLNFISHTASEPLSASFISTHATLSRRTEILLKKKTEQFFFFFWKLNTSADDSPHDTEQHKQNRRKRKSNGAQSTFFRKMSYVIDSIRCFSLAKSNQITHKKKNDTEKNQHWNVENRLQLYFKRIPFSYSIVVLYKNRYDVQHLIPNRID